MSIRMKESLEKLLSFWGLIRQACLCQGEQDYHRKFLLVSRCLLGVLANRYKTSRGQIGNYHELNNYMRAA